MSWTAFETLTVQPDFTLEPDYGIEGGRSDVAGLGADWVAWVGHTDLILRMDYKTTSEAEYRTLREFLDRRAGRHEAFYVPGWRADFVLFDDVAGGTGVTTIRVEGNWHTTNMTEGRPDTVGRRIFIVNHTGVYADFWVVGAIDDGNGNDILTLDRELANSLTAGKCMIGLVYFVRLASDDIGMTLRGLHLAEMTLTFRGISHTRRTEDDIDIEDDAIFTLNGPLEARMRDQDPLITNQLIASAQGPFAIGVEQTDNFQSEWQAYLSDINTVILVDPGGGESTTTLYDGAQRPNHLTLGFDAVSNAVIAWHRAGTIRVAWSAGGTQRLNFPGYSPVLFNTFAIDGTITAGESTTALFYLRAGDPNIYVRTIVESFSVEHVWANKGVRPLYLQAVKIDGLHADVVGMDANHRRGRWRSAPYSPFTPHQVAHVGAQETISGGLLQAAVFAPTEPGVNVGASETIELKYVELRVGVPTEQAVGVGAEGTIDGTYRELRVPVTGPSDAKVGVTELEIEYREIAKFGAGESSAIVGADPAITGTYEAE